MGKASSAKKVARAARAGGSRRAGQRRQLGFPILVGLVLVIGVLIVLVARDRRNADAFPQAHKDHIHATLGVFLDQVGISMTDTALQLTGGKSFTEGTTKCEGGKDGIVQVAKWDHANEAASGADPNQIITSGFDKIRLGANESFVIAFL